MGDKFIKKYWEEECILFYIHFQKGLAIRQVEITDKSKVRLSLANPFQGGSMLYDQHIDDLELLSSDFITEDEFNHIGNESN